MDIIEQSWLNCEATWWWWSAPRFAIVPLALLCGCGQEANVPTRQTIPKVDVWLGDRVERITGVKVTRTEGWPRSASPIVGTDQPCEVTIHLPDGRSLTVMSEATFMNESYGRVSSVTVTPFPKLLSWEESLTEIERLAKSFGIDRNPLLRDATTDAELRASPTERISNKVQLSEDVNLYIELKQHGDGDEYYASFNFTVPALVFADLPKRPAP